MRAAILVGMPLASGLAAFAIRSNTARRGLLVGQAVAHVLLVATLWVRDPGPTLFGLFQVDAPGLLFLSLASLLFLASAVYGVGYLRAEKQGQREDFQGQGAFVNAPETRFTACLLLFEAAMSLVCLSGHLGLLWAGVEATTLASAPLIFFHRHHRSLEAAWKYLLICSVGIALALLGTVLLAMAAGGGDGEASLLLTELTARAKELDPAWFRPAFVFLLVGYGTKMGLAPMHSWKPDAYSESPSLVSTLLSGALSNCAFLGILRVFQVACASGNAAFAQDLLLAFGLCSLAFAAVFVMDQGDYKRMLAYSSVEHMGLMAFSLGIGGAAVFGGLLHAVNHSLAKGMLFLTAGNILAAYHTKSGHDITGAVHALPRSGPLWMAGFLAIAGLPPFGLFVSEFTILRAAFETGHWIAGLACLGLLAVVFIGMAQAVLRMSLGPVPAGLENGAREAGPLMWLPPLALLLPCLLFGLYLPGPLLEILARAARLFATGGQP
jgi:hydrogenase-4 component F